MINRYSLKKRLILCVFFTAFSCVGYSQLTPRNSNFWNEVHFGGNLGLGFGKNSFNLSISPSAIYQATEQLGLGAGLNFNYAKFQNAKLLAYGGSVISLFNPIPALQLSAELEQLRVNRELELDGGNPKEDYWSPALFLGIGYGNRNVTIGIRYDVLHDPQKSIYYNALMPFVRVYF
ncbi:alpha-ketoglutarate decarboxylase [Arenibacter sp. TNZ]|jgi:long-subunit fatty acid transport protein|uniref:alpha-ketoglutarate decarboxylase n=1 Tax=Arenibacter TaxID=178469 RepID=UPI000CD42A22|nr:MULTISPECIES: alpha-ketoglutarate decarboxylase [Arenibacter]MCM4173850.1 alpha-ketoglutarate decarboxylase [Arenibacter sp. TNZ]